MSTRHYLKIEKDGETLCEKQIIGNNDFFDEEFYKNIGFDTQIINDEGFCEDFPIENYPKFLYEWHKWLERNPKKRGMREINISNLEMKETLESITLSYLTTQTYEMELYNVSRALDEYKVLPTDTNEADLSNVKFYLSIY